MPPCNTLLVVRGEKRHSPACRTRWQPSDGPIREYALPPPCATPLGDPTTVVLAAFLRSAPNPHGGAFRAPANDVRRPVHALLQRSPGLCPSQLHVVHDTNLTDRSYRGATLHRVAGNASLLGNDLRWAYFRALLRRLEWRCAYAVDLTDVNVLCLPACSESKQLHFSGEACEMISKQWMYGHMVRMRLRRSAFEAVWPWWGKFLTFLDEQGTTVNSGVVGGHRTAFAPALESMVEGYERLWRTRAALNWSGSDMFAWNGIALTLNRTDVVRGYPFGPVTLPWMGKLVHEPGPGQELCLNVRHSDPDHPGSQCRNSSACVGMWASELAGGRYWFAHKLPEWWGRVAAAGARRAREAAGLTGGCPTQVVERVGGPAS
eukprot:1711403-Prymnesium_polylepis.1